MTDQWEERRQHLLKRARNRVCVSCGSEAIQLVNHMTIPAQWRCEKCGVEWDWEPRSR